MTQLLSSTTIPSFRHIRLVDLNGDSHADLIAADEGDSLVFVMVNNGTGGFGAATNLTGVNGTWDVSAADVNGDGHVDIAASGGGCSNVTFGVYWFQNDGNVTVPGWSNANTIAPGTPSSVGAERMSLGDIDNDGYMDAVVLWEQVKFVLVFLSYLQVQVTCRFKL